jgi:1,4-dihydroxy-2-naphthoyl-CoA hydrolase
MPPARHPAAPTRGAEQPDGRHTSSELMQRMGIVVTEATSNRVVATMPVEGNRQAGGVLNGGASCVLAESIGSYAASLAAGPDHRAVGVDINATHHRAVSEGTVTGVATALHAGRKIATYEVRITDENERAICTARITCMILPKEPAR